MEQMSPERLPHNVPGKFFTTSECDGCAYCASVAPDNFDFEKETNTYFVAKQPATPEEEEFVREALEDCPVDAIRTEDPVNHAPVGRT
jgi:ferredoxin